MTSFGPTFRPHPRTGDQLSTQYFQCNRILNQTTFDPTTCQHPLILSRGQLIITQLLYPCTRRLANYIARIAITVIGYGGQRFVHRIANFEQP